MFRSGISSKKVESDSASVVAHEDTGINWDDRLEFGLGYLGLSPEEFWNLTPQEYNWKIKGMLRLEEDRFERLLINTYYSGYGMVPKGKGNKTMKPDKFITQFLSEDRKNRLHKEKIKRIKRITEDTK